MGTANFRKHGESNWFDDVLTSFIVFSTGFHNILVPTVELLRVQTVALSELRAGRGVLVGGPTGTGKTCLVQGALSMLDHDK